VKGPPFPTLPDEVMERLSIHGQVRLAVGPEGNSLPATATAAPLRDQLYLLLRLTPELREKLEHNLRAELRAEDPRGEWTVTARGRLHIGRSARSDERRSELFHWIPEGATAAELDAAVFYPEFIDYQKGLGGARTRAAGPVPGSAPPPHFAGWMRVAGHKVAPWLLGVFACDWVWLLFQEDRLRNGVILAVMFGIGAALLGGVTLIGVRQRHDAWRRGGSTRDAADALVLAGLPPGNLYTVGTTLVALGLVFTLLLIFVANGWTALFAAFVSGAPILAPFSYARYGIDREVT
jgi:hypothetical protein